MKKGIILLSVLSLLLMVTIVNADLLSETDYYFTLDYPDSVDLVSTTPYVWTNGATGLGIIDGGTDFITNTYLTLDNFPVYNSSLSVSLWLNTGGLGDGVLFAKVSGPGASFYRYMYGDVSACGGSDYICGRIYGYWDGGYDCVFRTESNVSLRNSNWHHIIITKDGSNICSASNFKVFVDSVEHPVIITTGNNTVMTGLSSFDASPEPYEISSSYGGNNYDNGLMDEFAIFIDYLLTQDDVDSLYNSGVGLQYPYCSPNWSCNLWGDCQIDDTKSCIDAVDGNACGENYTGNYTEFGTQSCDYCTPSWSCSSFESECPPDKIKGCLAVNDANDCYATTGLSSDEFAGNLIDYDIECGFQATYSSQDFRDMVVDGFGFAGAEILANIGLIIISIIVVGGVITTSKIWSKTK